MLCFQSLAVLPSCTPSIKRFFNVRRQLHLAKHTSINSAQEGLSLLLWWEDALSGCKSNQANSACLLPWAHVMLIKQPRRLQQFSVWAYLVSWSQFACTFASLLSIRGGFPTIAYIFLLLLPLVPHVWWFNKTEISCYFNGLNLHGRNVSISFGTFAFTLGLLRYSRLSTVLWNKNKGNIVGPWNKERDKSTFH